MAKEKYQIYPNVIKNANFIGLWVLFGIVYISNVHSAEKKLRKTDRIQKEIDDVRRAYIQVKDKTLYDGTMYEIVKNVDGIEVEKGIKIPKKIKRS